MISSVIVTYTTPNPEKLGHVGSQLLHLGL